MEYIRKLNKLFFYISLFLMSLTFSIAKNGADLDLWHRMAVGKIFSQLGHVIYHDIFTYFPSRPLWVDHEWLSGVIFYNLGHFFGDFGILSLKVLIIFSILILIYKTNQLIWPEPDKQRIGFYFITLISVLIGISASLRCQAFTYLFFTLWLYLLERIKRGENRLIWIFPLTTLIWANMHAGFVAGFGLIIFYALGEFLNKKSFSKYLGILALCLPVTFINPYGIKYWRYLIEAITMPRPYITEWMPLNLFENFFKAIGIKIQLLLIIPAWVYWLFSKYKNKLEKVNWIEIIAFSVTLYLGFKHLRHIVFFSITAAAYGYKYFAIFMDAVFDKFKSKLFTLIPEPKHIIIHFAKLIIVYGAMINLCLVIISGSSSRIDVSVYPAKAVEFIKINNLKGNLLVPFNWGSYALWKLYPQNLISVDGRYEETYTNDAYADISRLTHSIKGLDQANWKKTFYKYHNDIVLINKDNSLQKYFSDLKDWKTVYEDKKAIVLVPSSTPDKKWLQPNQNEEYYIETKYENNINF